VDRCITKDIFIEKDNKCLQTGFRLLVNLYQSWRIS